MLKQINKKAKIVILAVGVIVIFMGYLLMSYFESSEINDNTNASFEVELGEALSDELYGELENLLAMPHLFFESQQQISMFNLAAGEQMAYYTFLPDEWIHGNHSITDFGNGYYAVWLNDRFLLEQTITLFDENFYFIDSFSTLFFDYEEEIMFMQWNNVLRMVDGEIFIYGWENRDSRGSQYFSRGNLNTGEVERLFEGSREDIFNVYGFVGENKLLVVNSRMLTAWGEFPVVMYHAHGIVNLETGEKAFNEIENFAYGNVAVNDFIMIINEVHPEFRGFENAQRTSDKLIAFDLETHTSRSLELLPGDNFLAVPSLDGNYIVTVNIEEAVFRKYDMTENVIAEISLVFPSVNYFEGEGTIDVRSVQIFPLTERIYTVHINAMPWELNERHIQFIILP